MILLIDNYDSFTYNLFQYISELGETVQVVRNDALEVADIQQIKPEAIVLSPGPGTPGEAGICVETVQRFAGKIPILGICLGHQAIGEAFGGSIVHAKKVMHGKTSVIAHTGSQLFADFPDKLKVMRYHSLVVEKASVPASLKVTATAEDDGEIMALQHHTFPVYGLQFHPESIGTETGKAILRNFFSITRKEDIYETVSR
ncbi:aminodeoxychorismate/anthranilate synthase component II [Sediminibacillus dalangtanensis]|uniref:Aminodeoxychorismate/anthranilate synthase component II n=1 Tax=Sediminibacillus dalangtanensis TaxID=2729421 RepID=A0ABX7VWF8_9BACI|nr:aminodeoxychorismate/anthranilate synthase component II [Sediminibacillus dalangtanensis]QTN00997.1 aminodeoxychorismate/anthranilate synthase component II [Sediminibacillus dalangtanensis]